MSITIRPLMISTPDFEAFAHVKGVCFGGDEKEALEILKDNPRYNTSHVVVAESEGKIVGIATMYPAKLWLSGVPLDIGAIAGVGVLPEYRKQGAAAQMIEMHIKRAASEGYAMTVLFPGMPQYYHKFGFGVVGDLHAYSIAPSNLMEFEERSKVRDFEADDLPMMRVMYKGQMTWHNGWLSRSNEWWDNIIANWPGIVVLDNDGMIDGYLAYELKEEQGRKIFYIKEFFAAEGEAFRGLIGYLAGRTDVDQIEYLAPPDTPLRHSLHQPRSIDAKNRSEGIFNFDFHDLCHVTPGPMARITTLNNALTKRFYARHMQGERVIKLTDPLVPGNEEVISFRLVDGRAESKPARPGKEPQVEADIRTFTQILCGYLPAIDAQRLGRLKADEDTCSWFDKAVADSPLYIQSGDWF